MRALQFIGRHPKSGVFRFRRDLPPHLRPVLGQKVFTETLNTKEEGDAFRLGLGVVDRYQKLFDEAEAVHRQRAAGEPVAVALTLGTAAGLVDRWREAELARVASEVAARPHGLAPTREAVERYLENLSRPLATRKLLAEAAQGRASGVAAVDGKGQEIARSGGFVLPKGHPMHATMAAMVRTAWEAVLRQEEEWTKGGWSLDNLPVSMRPHLAAHAPPPAAAVAAAPPRTRQMSVREMFGWYCKRRPKASATTRSEQRLAMDRLCDFLGGDVPVHTIAIGHAEEFFDALSASPRSNPKALKTIGLRDLAAWTRPGGGGAGSPTVSLGTVVKQVRLLSAMVAEAVRLGYADANPFLAVIPHDADAMGLKRAPFSPRDIATIFGAPLFQGCRDDGAWDAQGGHRVSDHRFWIPLLLLATGARLEEIGQLLVRDIKEEGGVLYIHVTDIAEDDGEEEKNVKTAPSRRRVPLHRIVLDAGFRQYLDRAARSGDEALFPALGKDGRGKKTREFSKWFNQKFLEGVGITGRAKVLHSFRHLFKDRCREADLGEELHDALTGHAGGGVGRDYGAGFSVKRLAGGMARVEFPGFPGVMPPHPPEEDCRSGANG